MDRKHSGSPFRDDQWYTPQMKARIVENQRLAREMYRQITTFRNKIENLDNNVYFGRVGTPSANSRKLRAQMKETYLQQILQLQSATRMYSENAVNDLLELLT